MKQLLKIFILFISFTLIFCKNSYLFAQEEDNFLTTVEIGGFAEVQDNNRDLAKKEAVKDAIRKAVEEIVEYTVSPELLVENYGLVSGIYSKSEDYIHSYSFLSEEFFEENNIYTVTLQIKLYSRYIKSLLAKINILEETHNKTQKVLILIRERGLFTSNFEDFWENVPISEVYFTEKLLSNGFEVVDRETLRDKVDQVLIEKFMKGDSQAAIQVGLLGGAKIVLTGNASARRGGTSSDDPTKMKYQANISLKAYLTETGKILGARSEFITISNDDPELGELNAFNAAGEKIYNTFIRGIIDNNEDP